MSENPGIGQPCAFPGFVIAQQARPDRETEEECADAARYEYSSWQDLKNRLNANNYAGTGLLGKTVRAFFRHPVHSPETIYKIMMHDGGMSDYSPEVLGGGWPWWGYEWANLGHANRFMDSVAGSPTGMASMKFGNTEWSSVPEPQIYPIDYLNLMKAKMTPPGEEFKEIKVEGPSGSSVLGSGPCLGIELGLTDGRIIRFPQVDQLLEYLKKAA